MYEVWDMKDVIEFAKINKCNRILMVHPNLTSRAKLFMQNRVLEKTGYGHIDVLRDMDICLYINKDLTDENYWEILEI